MKRENSKDILNNMSENLFWDIDPSLLDLDACPSQIIQRVLENGEWHDWKAILGYYGIEKIAENCKRMRTLDPVALSFVCAITNTKKEDYRCYHTAQCNPTLWNC